MLLAGQVTVGGVASRTVTVNVHVPELLLLSVAVMVTTLAPSVNMLPEAGLWVLVGLAVQLSLAVADAV